MEQTTEVNTLWNTYKDIDHFKGKEWLTKYFLT